MRDDLSTIWQRVLADDEAAWRRLVTLFAPYVFSIARHCGLDRMEAEDCTQQVWISLYKNRQSVRDPLRISGWLRQTTRRRAVRMIERGNARKSRETIHTENMPTALEPVDLEKLEDQLLLEVALDQLEPRCQQLLRRLFFDSAEKSYREIADAMGLSINTLGSMRGRCLNKLKKILIKLGYRMD